MGVAVVGQQGPAGGGGAVLVGDGVAVGDLQEGPALEHDPCGHRLLGAVLPGQAHRARGGIGAHLDLNRAGAGLRRSGGGLNLPADHPAAPVVQGAQGGGLQAAVGADLNGGDALRPLEEALVLQPLMDLLHDHLPGQGRRVLAAGGDILRLVLVAYPHCGGIVGGVAGEVAVVVVVGGTGLTGHRHAADGGGAAGAAGDRVAQHLVHEVGGGLLHGHGGGGAVVHDHLRVVVGLDAGDSPGGGIHALVDEGAVGRRHLHGGHAVGQSAHGQGAQGQVTGVQVKAQLLLHKLEGAALPHGLQRAAGHGIDGALDAVGYGHVALVPDGGVLGEAAGARVVDPDGVVVHHAHGAHHVVLQGGGVNAHGLDGAARGTAGGGQVQPPVHRLDAHAAGHGLHIPGVGVHDGDGGVQRRTLVGGVVEVGGVLVDLVHNGLDVRVQGGVDVVTAVVEQKGGRVPAHAPLGHDESDGLVDGGVLKPGVDLAQVHGRLLVLTGLRLGEAVLGLVLGGVGEEELLRLGGLALRLGDEAHVLAGHAVEDVLLAALVEVPAGLVGAVVL